MRARLMQLGRVALVLAMGTPALLADGAQTGTIAGTVKDAAGKAISGVNLRIEGTNLQGARTARSGANGEFRLLLVPPGDYSLTASADGFQSVKVNVSVSINQATRVNIPLSAIGKAEIVVESTVSSIDTTTVTTQANIAKDVADRLPVGRTYQGMMLLSPGVSGGANPNVLGGQSSENIYLVDGVDTTDPTTGTFGLNLAQDSIEEVQILTTGISAEFGRFNGAVANVVTKSGTNSFEGHVRADFSNVSWNALAPMGTKQDSNLVKTYYATVGGPILKDKLWYFISVQKVKTSGIQTTTGPLGGGSLQFDRVFDSDPLYYSAKLTWAINANHTLIFQRTGDPSKINRVLYGTTTFLDTTTYQTQGGDFTQLSYRGILSPNLTLEGKVAMQQSEITVKGNGGDKVIFYDQTDAAGRQYENGPFEGYVKRPRTQANFSVSWYPEWMGTHEIRTGVDYQETKSKNKFGAISNREVYFDGFVDGSAVNGLDYDMVPGSSFLAEYTPAVENTSKQKYTALYFNDHWKINNHWTVNLGVRLEKVKGDNDIGETIFDYNTTVPRLGLTYDPKGDSSETYSLTYGRYYQSPWQDSIDGLNRLAQGYSLYDYVAGDPHQRTSFASSPFYSFSPESDGTLQYASDLKGSYTSEVTGVYKRQFSARTSFQAVGVYKEFNNQLDTRVFYDPTSHLKITRLENATNSRRHYGGLLLSLDHRGDKWYFYGNWTISRLYGNIDSASQTSSFNNFTTGAYTPAINNNNASGLLSADRTHLIKAFAARRFSWGKFSWDNGFRGTYTTGAPYSVAAVRSDPASGIPSYVLSSDRRFTVYLGGLRNQARFYDTWSVDYSTTFTWAFTERYQVYLRADITNILNHQEQGTWNTTMSVSSAGAWTPGSNFGKPTGPGNYITPRTLGFTLGVRF